MKILITGGASGLGRAITALLASDPENDILFTWNSSEEEAKSLEKEYSNVKGIMCRFENENDIKDLSARIPEFEPEVLINNAFPGPLLQVHFHKQNTSSFTEGFNKNILPVIQITQTCITFFRKKKNGRIITILSSAITNRPPIGWSQYCAEKNYLLSLAKSWAVENASFNICSNCISPSFMQTSLTKETDERIVEEIRNQHPQKKILTVKETAEAVKFFVHCSSQVNGTNLLINSALDLM